MADIRAFRALRPRADVAARVAAVPYDVVSTDEARALASTEPLSFLHVSRAEIDLPADVSPYGEDVYSGARRRFEALREEMVQEDEPALYLYRLRMGDHVQTGLAACYSVSDYERQIIKKHERTRPDKEDDRTRHIIELRAQTGPVFLTYRRRADLDAIVERVVEGHAPLYDFTASDDVVHTIWRVPEADARAIARAFEDVPALYIADGHHRAASAARAHEHFARTEPGLDAEHAWFLAVAFPDDQVQILPYHRVVTDLADVPAGRLLDDVQKRFEATLDGSAPVRRGECAMYLAGDWYRLRLDADAPPADPIADLDVSRLQERVLGPLLGVGDPRTDPRLDFVGGLRGARELERLVDEGRAAVAFALFPVNVDDLIAVSDAGGIMPPKSTWFEPKLRDGLLTHLI